MIENNFMPSGNVDYPYIIKFILVDINNKTIDCPDKFSYQFSNSNTTFTDYDCNSNHLYINKSFPIMDEYSFIIPMMNKTYSFEINQGERYIIIKIFNCTENIGTGQNATITLPLDVKDKYNNSVPDEEINNKFKIILTDNSHNISLFKIKENGLIKYTSIIKVANTYYWDLFYNEKKINTSKHYTTKVIAYPYFPRTTCSISLKEVLNGSKLDFYDYYSEIDIFPHDNYSNFVQDIILMRYAEILLRRAECLNELGRTSEAMQYVDMVRARAGHIKLSDPGYKGSDVSTQEGMREKIRNEFYCELGGEDSMYFNELRWGTWYDLKFKNFTQYAHDTRVGSNGLMEIWGKIYYSNTPVSALEGNHGAWPIPQKEREMNPDLTQNPGWTD